MNKKQITIYTDGSSLGNPGKGGWAAILSSGEKEKILTGGFRHTTNNRMEIMGIIEGLKCINGKNHDVTIYTDSQLIANTINKSWIYNWQKNGWKKSDKTSVLNIDLWKSLAELMKINNIKINWVKGHNGLEGNERCDILSKQAAEKATEIDFGYEKDATNDTIFEKPLNIEQAKIVSVSQQIMNNNSFKLLENKPYQLLFKDNNIVIEKNNDISFKIKFNIKDKSEFLKKLSTLLNDN